MGSGIIGSGQTAKLEANEHLGSAPTGATGWRLANYWAVGYRGGGLAASRVPALNESDIAVLVLLLCCCLAPRFRLIRAPGVELDRRGVNLWQGGCSVKMSLLLYWDLGAAPCVDAHADLAILSFSS
jgi:hypothetical protein